MKSLFLLAFVIIAGTLYSQNQHALDSLYKVSRTAKDTTLANVYNNIAWEYRKTDADSARKYVNLAKALSVKHDHHPGKRFSVYLLGIINDYAGNYDSALYYYNSSAHLYTAAHDKKGLASAYNNIGAVYNFQGKYDKALEYYFRSLALKEELGDKQGIGRSYNNIGIIYEYLKDFEKALEYYQKSLQLKKELGNKEQLASTFSNISGVYQSKKDYKTALAYADSSVAYHLELQDWNGLGLTYNSIASLYSETGNFEAALQYLEKALEIQKKIEDKWGEAYTTLGIAQAYFYKKDYRKVIEFALDGTSKAAQLGAIKEELEGQSFLYQSYEALGDKDEALRWLKRYVALKDTFINSENRKSLTEWQTKYEVATKEKQIESLNKEKLVREKEAHVQMLIRNFSIGLAAAVLIIAGMIYRQYRNKRIANIILGKQKEELKIQKKLIEEKNRQISDSIDYARYIQDAVLPDIPIQALVPSSFLYYAPRDVVSGDFYWYERSGDKVYIAAADCTGHGIPGAFMSMIGTILLNEIFNEKKAEDPGMILYHLNRLLKKSLKQTAESTTNRNGMDISLTCFDQSTGILRYAGANRPLWIIRDVAETESDRLETYSPDKVSIGGLTDDHYMFITREIPLKKGDTYFMFSDGLADQFGGGTGKKFTTKRLKKLLMEINELPMLHQDNMIRKQFGEWKGEHEQVDDVLIIGVKNDG